MRSLPLSLILALSAAPLSAQSLYAVDSAGTTYQFNGPQSGPCSYPSGPLLGQFSYTNPYFCPHPAALPAAPSLLGDMAVDRQHSELWITDGLSISHSQSFGTIIAGFAVNPGDFVPGALTGLGYDSQTNFLWITDGTSVAAIVPPPDPGCPGSPSFAVPAFALPLAPGATATDVEWDPASNMLWISDDQGFVSQVTLAGALGPAGRVAISSASPCPLGPVLQSIALDTVTNDALYATDGAQVYRADRLTGAPASPTFYSPAPCSSAMGPYKGLGFAATGTLYGTASNGIFPAIGASYPSVVPNPQFEVMVVGAKKNELCGLVIGFGPLCPFLPLGNGKVYTLFAPNGVLAIQVVPATGLVTFHLPLAPSVPIGAIVYLQGLTYDPATAKISSTPGIQFGTSYP